MKTILTNFRRSKSIPILLLIVVVIGVLIPISPSNQPLPRRDSGVFLYVGWRWINGDIPYRDVWDHKPPIVFLINAIGLFVSNSSRWGIWVIELFSLLTASLLSFSLFRRAFDAFSAFLAVLIWIFSLAFMLYGGNLTTEYTLPLQFACLWLFWDSETTKKYRRNGFLIGLSGSALLFTQQVSVGIVIAIILYIGITRACQGKWSEMLGWFTSIGIGFLTLTSMIVIYFAIQGALVEFWDAAFLYNFAYVATPTFVERLKSIYRGWLLLSTTNLLAIGVLGWCIVLSGFMTKSIPIASQHSPLLLLGLINLPVEVMLVSVGGRLIDHHFMVLLPVFSLFGAFFLHLVLSGIRSWLSEQRKHAYGLVAVVACILAVPVMYLKPVLDYTDIIGEYQDAPSSSIDLAAFIEQHSQPEDTVLVLPAETTINFIAQRKSPTKYVYQYPLRMKGYATEEMIQDYLEELLQHPPALIVNHQGSGLGSEFYAVSSDQIDYLVSEVEDEFILVTTLGDWNVYMHR